jgi:hypothetical protein
LECINGEPTIWRYYPAGDDSFKTFLRQVADKYPILDVSHAVFRLFRTTTIGKDYQLP